MIFLHYCIKFVIHFFLHFFWIFPVKKKRIFFINELSFKYGDNLKYLCEYLKKNSNYELMYALKYKDEAKEHGFVYVKPFTFRYFRYLLTSSVIITNAGGLSYLPIRKSQLTINTWHGGGPYKKTGNALHQDKWYLKELQQTRKNTSYMLSSCEYFSKYEAPAMLFYGESCVCSGMPRNDLFFQKDNSLRNKVFSKYGIDTSKKIVLFAPTFRANSIDFTYSKKYHVSDIDYENLLLLLEKKFGGDWKLGIRLHPKLHDVEIDIPDAINFTNYPDMQELLYAAAIVITDFSSLMWDFSLTFRPCFLYADDIDVYEREHGFYMPSKQWPYPIARNNEELTQNIINFELEKYQEAVKKHHKDCGSYEQGTACKTVMNIINKHITKE